MDDILNLANQSSARDKVIILDCCHSGAVGTPSITGSNLAQLSEGLSVLTASRDSESALEVNGSGIFTSLVIDALNGGASDVRGNITPGSIYAYVDEALGAWDQRPIFRTNVTRFTALRTITPKVPLQTLRKIIDYFPSPESHHPLDPTYEFTDASAIKRLSISSLKFPERLPWLSQAAFFVGADCCPACSASMVAMTCAIPAKPFTRLNCCSQ